MQASPDAEPHGRHRDTAGWHRDGFAGLIRWLNYRRDLSPLGRGGPLAEWRVRGTLLAIIPANSANETNRSRER